MQRNGPIVHNALDTQSGGRGRDSAAWAYWLPVPFLMVRLTSLAPFPWAGKPAGTKWSLDKCRRGPNPTKTCATAAAAIFSFFPLCYFLTIYYRTACLLALIDQQIGHFSHFQLTAEQKRNVASVRDDCCCYFTTSTGSFFKNTESMSKMKAKKMLLKSISSCLVSQTSLL